MKKENGNNKLKIAAAVLVTAISGALLLVYGGTFNKTVADKREKYIDQAIARRYIKMRQNSDREIDVPDVIHSPLIPPESGVSGNNGAPQQHEPRSFTDRMQTGNSPLLP